MKTAEAMITLVLKKKKEKTDGTGHWSRAEILDRLNDWQDILDVKLGGLTKSVVSSLSTTIGQAYVSLSTTIRKIISVSFDGDEIEFTTEDELVDRAQKGEISSSWRTDSGTPVSCFQRGNQLFFYPIPTTATSIGVFCFVNLTAMTDSASSYPLSNQEQLRTAQMALIYLVLMDLCAEDGDGKLDGFASLYNSVFDGLATENLLSKRKGFASKKNEKIQDDDL